MCKYPTCFSIFYNHIRLILLTSVFYITESIPVGVTSILVQNTRTLADEKT